MIKTVPMDELPVASLLAVSECIVGSLRCNNQIFVLFLPKIQLSETKFKASHSQLSSILPGNMKLRYETNENVS